MEGNVELNFLGDTMPLDEVFDYVIENMQHCHLHFMDPDIRTANEVLEAFCDRVKGSDHCVLVDIDLFQITQDIPVEEERIDDFFRQWFEGLENQYEEKTGLRYTRDAADTRSAISDLLREIGQMNHHAFLSIRNMTVMGDVFKHQADILNLRDNPCGMFFSGNIKLFCVEQFIPGIGNSVLSETTRNVTVDGNDPCTTDYKTAYEELKRAFLEGNNC